MSMEIKVEIMVSVFKKADVVVIGGGPAGIAAAIAAARCGKKVLLVEQTAQLGGMATLGNVSIFMGVGNFTGIYREIVEEFMPEQLEARLKNRKSLDTFCPQFNPFLFRLYLNSKLEKEGVEVLYHCSFVKAICESGHVKAVLINTRDGIKMIEGLIFIDSTGDGRVSIDAGAAYTTGREDDGVTQLMTLMFSMQDTGKAVRQFLPEECTYYMDESELPAGGHLYWEESIDKGTLLINMTRVSGNGACIDDVNRAEKEALKQVFSITNYLQRNGFSTYILSHVASQTGVRETNQIKGEYTLTEEDIFQSRCFEDVVAQSFYSIDIHSPDGKDKHKGKQPDIYDIPYRCLIPKGVESLIVAGRALSATHTAMSSVRVQPTCMALGQAAGVAASIAIDDECLIKSISIKKLHKILKEQGVELGGV